MTELEFHSLQSAEGPFRGKGGHDAKPPRLLVSTPKGTLREVPLTREQLLGLAETAISIVRQMDRP